MGRRFTARRDGSQAHGRCAFALAIAGLLVAVPALLLPAAAGASTWERGVPVAAPAMEKAELMDVACSSAADCVGVGVFWDSRGRHPMVVTKANGSWGQPVEIVTPEPTEPAELMSVACTAPGSCVAVGRSRYGNGSGQEPIAVDSSGGSWGSAVEIEVPSGAEDAELSGVACPAADSCVAVGSYEDSSHDPHAIAATMTGGTWASAVEEVTAPAGGEFPSLRAVACTAPGSCVAVGEYRKADGVHGMAVSWAGPWGPAVEVEDPSEGRDARLDGIACPAADSCVAVGHYETAAGETHALSATLTAGAWQQAIAVELASETKRAELSGVACPAVGSCAAVGSYRDSSDETHAVAIGAASGTWGAVTEVEPPAGMGHAELSGVACPATGSCVTVGSAEGGGAMSSIAADEVSGTWGQAAAVAPPSGTEESWLYGVACPAGSCAAVGEYTFDDAAYAGVVGEAGGVWGRQAAIVSAGGRTGGELRGVACRAPGSCLAVGISGEQAIAVTEAVGAWGQPVEVEPPNVAEESWLADASCPVSGDCVAVGGYVEGGETHAMAATEVSGTWGRAVEVTAPSGAKAAVLNGVSCPAAGSCFATGGYEDEQGQFHAMAATLSAGAWGQGVEVEAPHGAEDAELWGVDCAGGGACEAVGVYRTSSGEHAMAAAAAAGAWGRATEVETPPGGREAELFDVACRTDRSCVAVGAYWSGSRAAAMAVPETNGSWGQGVEVKAPAGAGEAELSGVACPATGPCAAVGGYEDDSVWHAMTTREAPAPVVAPPIVRPAPAAICAVGLRGAKIAVKHGKARVRIANPGTARCAGRVKLAIKVKAKRKRRHKGAAKHRAKGARAGRRSHRARLRTIGSASFHLAAGKTATIAVKLNHRGRAALRAHHGRLRATLSIMVRGRRPITRHVRLRERRKHHRHHRKRHTRR